MPRRPRSRKGYQLQKAHPYPRLAFRSVQQGLSLDPWNAQVAMVMVLVSVLAELPVASVT